MNRFSLFDANGGADVFAKALDGSFWNYAVGCRSKIPISFFSLRAVVPSFSGW
jgi:hypothetical protein